MSDTNKRIQQVRKALNMLAKLLYIPALVMPPPNPPPERAWVFVNPLKPPK